MKTTTANDAAVEACARAAFNEWYGDRGVAVAGWEFTREPVKDKWRAVARVVLSTAKRVPEAQ